MTHEKITHIDLFSGIGGFSLAADWAWGKGNVRHVFVENDPFCQAVLRKHWPEAEMHGDIRTFVADAKDKEQQLAVEREQDEKNTEFAGAHLLTGGFPCQPFSHAGRRKGTADDRYLWPPMRDAIALFRPRWVIAENVAGLASWNDGLVLETVCSDLEKEGYEVCPFVIPACSVGAPHKRDRVWIVANCTSGGQRSSERKRNSTRQSKTSPRNGDSDAPDTKSTGLQRSKSSEALQRRKEEPHGTTAKRIGSPAWREDWPQAAARLCTLDDGLSNGLVRPKGWRNAALKAAGNAIVPQVAYQIMKRIH